MKPWACGGIHYFLLYASSTSIIALCSESGRYWTCSFGGQQGTLKVTLHYLARSSHPPGSILDPRVAGAPGTAAGLDGRTATVTLPSFQCYIGMGASVPLSLFPVVVVSDDLISSFASQCSPSQPDYVQGILIALITDDLNAARRSHPSQGSCCATKSCACRVIVYIV